MALYLKIVNYLYPTALFSSNWPSGTREEFENVKSLQTDNRQTDTNS